jgi:hypothetical protein
MVETIAYVLQKLATCRLVYKYCLTMRNSLFIVNFVFYFANWQIQTNNKISDKMKQMNKSQVLLAHTIKLHFPFSNA